MLNFSKTTRAIEYWLGILALTGIFIFIYLSMSGQLHDPDIWLHLKTGEYIIQNQAVPQVDSYSAAVAGKPWIDHSPLAQIAYYGVFLLGGVDGLIIFSAIMMLAAFLLLFAGAYRNRSLMYLSITGLALAAFASRIRFNIRPENFSVLFFCFFLFALTRPKIKYLIFILPLVQVAWVNCHGFFIIGPALIALFVIGEGLKRSHWLPLEWSASAPLDKKEYRNLVLVFLFTMLACLINPNGLRGALYPLSIILKSLVEPNVIHSRIKELLPTWRLAPHQILAYYLLLTVSFVSFCLNFRKINFSYLLAWLVLLGISLSINRNVIFFNCVAYLVCVDNFSRLSGKKIPGSITRDNVIFWLKTGALISILIFAGLYNWRALNERYYSFKQEGLKSTLRGRSEAYPDQAIDYILEQALPDNLFNIFNHGSYLIYRLYPQNHVFIDGRTELYSNELLNDYSKLLYTDGAQAGRLLEKYNLNTVFLSGNLVEAEELITYLGQSKEWVLVFLNEEGLIFVRQNALSREQAEKLRVNLDKLEIKKAQLEKIGLRRIQPAPYTRLAQIFFALGADQKAELQAKEALSILPSSDEAYAILGKIYLRRNNPQEAYRNLRLAAIYGPNRLLTLSALSSYYLKTGKHKYAETILKKTIKLFPRYPDTFYNLGTYYEDAGDLKNAQKYLRQATKLAPYSSKFLDKFKEVSAKTKSI